MDANADLFDSVETARLKLRCVRLGDAAGSRRGVLAYWLGKKHHGYGYMREAAPATVAAAFERLDLEVIEAGAQPGNAASFAILRSCGMAPAGERMVFASARGRDELCLLYEVMRPAG